jgi:hypothetical protein
VPPVSREGRPKTVAEVSLMAGFRSGLEEEIAAQLLGAKVPYEYEELVLQYEVHETHKYTPDFLLLRNGIVVESKGRWVTADRKKIKLVLAQYPDIDFRMVFSNSRQRISKQSQTTYGDICTRLGIPFADKKIPEAWWKEPPNTTSLAAIKRLKEVRK